MPISTRNADLLCGISPKFHLGHVVANVKEIEDIAISLDEQVKLIPSGSGIEELIIFLHEDEMKFSQN